MEIMYGFDNGFFKDRKFIGFYGNNDDLLSLVNLEYIELNDKYKVKKYLKDNKYLDIVEIDDDVLNKKISSLSSYELKMIYIIYIASLNPSIIYLEDIDVGMNSRFKSKLSKLIRTFNADKGINFIIKSTDAIYVNKISKDIVICKDKKIKYEGDVLSAVKAGLIDKPEIIKFIDKANLKGANLKYTLDSKELLKSIYRSVF